MSRAVLITPTEDAHLWKTVCWIRVKDQLPDDDMTVLVHVDGEVWTGFIEAGLWHYVSGDPIGGRVTHWCEFPDAPA